MIPLDRSKAFDACDVIYCSHVATRWAVWWTGEVLGFCEECWTQWIPSPLELDWTDDRDVATAWRVHVL